MQSYISLNGFVQSLGSGWTRTVAVYRNNDLNAKDSVLL
jgi:hypothetical protein